MVELDPESIVVVMVLYSFRVMVWLTVNHEGVDTEFEGEQGAFATLQPNDQSTSIWNECCALSITR